MSVQKYLLSLASVLVLCIGTAASTYAQPLLYKAEFNGGSVYILGGTDVPDNNWLDSRIQQALDASTTLWLEIPPADADAAIPPVREEVIPGAAAAMHPAAVEEGYGNLGFGDYMDVAMGERSVVESQRLNLEGINFRAMQPWLAYFTFNDAFWDQQNLALENPESLLIARAKADNKEINSLFADREAYYRFMGRMSDTAQTHFFQFMYNTFDWQRSGEYESRYNWVNGQPDEQWLEKMRTQNPSYYRFMYLRRNTAIAEQLQEIISPDSSQFLYVDINRLLGPDSLLKALTDAGATVESL